MDVEKKKLRYIITKNAIKKFQIVVNDSKIFIFLFF